MSDFKSTAGKTLAGILRDVMFYDAPMRQQQLGQPISTAAANFARGMMIVIDGQSHLLTEPHPHAGPYNDAQRSYLLFRSRLFGEPMALRLLKANFYHHFEQKAS